MLCVRSYPALATWELVEWLRPHVHYDYEGRCSRWLVEGTALPDELSRIVRTVCPEVLPAAWSVALQGYRNGLAGTPCHSDAGSTGLGFIFSLGAARTLRFHRVPEGANAKTGCGDHDLDVIEIQCGHGMAIIMNQAFHESWHHQVVSDPTELGERLSLVFRTPPK